MITQHPTLGAVEAQQHLQQLLLARALADVEGLSADPAYMAALQEDIAATRVAYVGAAVTAIATLRGQLSGRLHG